MHYVQTCGTCRRMKTFKLCAMSFFALQSSLSGVLAVGFAGPSSKTSQKKKYILV